MTQAERGRNDYTGFMMNRTTLAGLLLALGAPLWASPSAAPAIREARIMANGGPAALGAGYDGGVGRSAVELATEGALKKGGLDAASANERPALVIEVPAPNFNNKNAGASKEAPFFSGLNDAGKMSVLGGAAVGAGVGGLLGGVVGVGIGAVIGGLVGFLLSKLL